MQIIKANRDSVLRPLQTVAGIVEKRTTLPILSNVLIRKEGGHGVLHRHRHRDAGAHPCRHRCERDGQRHHGLGPQADRHPAFAAGDGEVSMDLDSNRLRIKSGKSRFALQTLAADDFPTVAVSAEPGCEVETVAPPRTAQSRHAADGPLRDGPAGHPVLPQRAAARAEPHRLARSGYRRPTGWHSRRLATPAPPMPTPRSSFRARP